MMEQEIEDLSMQVQDYEATLATTRQVGAWKIGANHRWIGAN